MCRCCNVWVSGQYVYLCFRVFVFTKSFKSKNYFHTENGNTLVPPKGKQNKLRYIPGKKSS
jgi:hypothetical protein